MVLIKRYANRKLYNTDTSRYITLKGVAELIEQGADVRVIDNESGDDITSVALGQILVDHERSNKELPRTLLSDILQKGGDALYGALKRGVGDASESLEGIQRNVRRAIGNREQDVERARESWADTRDELKNEFDEAIQSAVERVFKALDLPRRSDIVSMNERLERLVEALERLESRRSPAPPATPTDSPDE
jgi:polyhydroxyalkanoate synthesis repressor PhaR